MLAEGIEKIQQLAQSATTQRAAKLGDYILVPEGYTAADLSSIAEKALEAPRRKKAKVSFFEAQSFIDYFGQHKSASSVLFGDPALNVCTVTATLDYHGKAGEAAGWCQHVATLSLKATPAWTKWLNHNGKPMKQVAFAQFIEDNARDIYKPEGEPAPGMPTSAEMIEVSRSLEAKKSVDFSSSVRLNTGQQQIKWSETIDAKVGTGNIEVPERFNLRLECYLGYGPVNVQARLRFRIEDGKLVLWYDLYRPEDVVEETFERMVQQVEAGTGEKVLIGSYTN